jgi:hypothetical protein
LDWEARVPESYTMLFDLLREKLSLPFSDLSFENFRQLTISPDDLDVRPADQ